MGTSPSSDYSIPDKTRGFLFQESGDFQFIGPDREAIGIKTVNQYISIADIVREINKPQLNIIPIILYSNTSSSGSPYPLRILML